MAIFNSYVTNYQRVISFVDEALGHSDHTTPLAEIFDVIDHPTGQGAWGAAALACHGEDGFAAKKTQGF